MEAFRGLLVVATRHDARLYDRVAAARSPRRTRAMLALSRSGDATTYVALALVACIVGGTFGVAALAAALAATSASAIGWTIKRAIARPRPTTRAEARDALLAHPDAYSFPSGHTASAFAAAVMFGALFGPVAGTLALMWAASVGVSRVYVGAHYPLDVVLGAALGPITVALLQGPLTRLSGCVG